jgi:cbb3-type cytochrome c oxidase subunit III
MNICGGAVTRRTRLRWTLYFLTCIVVLAVDAGGQAPQPNGQRSTSQGVYSREQWLRGRDVYAGLCVSCHQAVTHVGPQFSTSWAGKKLSDLFGFLRERMPKNDPGSLSEQEYVDVMSYMLRLNGMPAGVDELPADSVALTRIRIDSSRVKPE